MSDWLNFVEDVRELLYEDSEPELDAPLAEYPAGAARRVERQLFDLVEKLLHGRVNPLQRQVSLLSGTIAVLQADKEALEAELNDWRTGELEPA